VKASYGKSLAYRLAQFPVIAVRVGGAVTGATLEVGVVAQGFVGAIAACSVSAAVNGRM
jgi:hypothetical protein